MGQIETNNSLVDLNQNMSVITLYVADWVKRQESTKYCLWTTYLKYEYTTSLEVEKLKRYAMLLRIKGKLQWNVFINIKVSIRVKKITGINMIIS